MIINKKQLAVIHIAKKQTGMKEDEYRALLSSAGVTSSKNLDGKGFSHVMDRFEAMGFKTTSLRKKAGNRRKVKNLPRSKSAMMWKIEAILLDMNLSWGYVDEIAKKRFGIEKVQWLESEEVRKIMLMMIYHKKRRHNGNNKN